MALVCGKAEIYVGGERYGVGEVNVESVEGVSPRWAQTQRSLLDPVPALLVQAAKRGEEEALRAFGAFSHWCSAKVEEDGEVYWFTFIPERTVGGAPFSTTFCGPTQREVRSVMRGLVHLAGGEPHL